jgi:hypothetical protein
VRYLARFAHLSGAPDEVNLPLHRALDLAILLVTAMIEERSGAIAGHHLHPIIVDTQGLNDLHDFINDKRAILTEILIELNYLILEYGNYNV